MLITIKLRSKNLIDTEEIWSATVGNYEVTENGVILEGAGHIRFWADLKKGETYVFSCKPVNMNGNCELAGKWSVVYTGGIVSNPIDCNVALTLTSDAEAVCVYLNSEDGEEGYAELSEIMLEKGSVATSYTPFVRELNTAPVKIGGRNLLEPLKWKNSKIADYCGIPCLKIVETGNYCFEIDAPRDAVFTFNCRVFRDEGSETKISNLKAKRDGVERHITGSQIHGKNVTATVYGGEQIYFIGWNSNIYLELSSLSLTLAESSGEYENFKTASTVYADENGNLTSDYSGGGLSVIVCEDGVVADVYYNRDINSVVSKLEKGE